MVTSGQMSDGTKVPPSDYDSGGLRCRAMQILPSGSCSEGPGWVRVGGTGGKDSIDAR